MLITTIQRETTDDDLFSKSAPILTAASEVAFHTMNTSSLNAEELRREEGISVRSLCVGWGWRLGVLEGKVGWRVGWCHTLLKGMHAV